jgi:hypothetical protein
MFTPRISIDTDLDGWSAVVCGAPGVKSARRLTFREP